MTIRSAAAATLAAKPLNLKTASGERPRLLLAEDSDPVRIVTAAMLKTMGCDVEAVIHGEEAVQQAGEQRFDVIVLDIEMPVMDGITAAKSIRRMGGPATGTPIMALSAFLADSMRNGTWHDTFDIALPKPANKNELHDAVKAALSWQQKAPENASPAHLPPLINQPELEAMRIGIAESIWLQLVELAKRDMEVCVNQLEMAVGNGNADMVKTYAGKLTALGRTFAAPRMALLAQRVRIASSAADRSRAIDSLIATARETVSALQG